MTTLMKFGICLGTILTLAGSFLPWQRQDDLPSYLIYGIRIGPFRDLGGLLIILLVIMVLMLVFRPPRFVQKPLLWNIGVSLGLVLMSTIHIGELLIRQAETWGLLGTPTIETGLLMVRFLMVAAGSILIFFTAVYAYRIGAIMTTKIDQMTLEITKNMQWVAKEFEEYLRMKGKRGKFFNEVSSSANYVIASISYFPPLDPEKEGIEAILDLGIREETVSAYISHSNGGMLNELRELQINMKSDPEAVEKVRQFCQNTRLELLSELKNLVDMGIFD